MLTCFFDLVIGLCYAVTFRRPTISGPHLYTTKEDRCPKKSPTRRPPSH